MTSAQLRNRCLRCCLAVAVAGGCLVAASPPASAAVTVTRVVFTTAATSSTKSAVATCPAGLKLVGGGGEIIDGLGVVVVTDVIPDQDLTKLTVTGAENDPLASTWKVRATAICSSSFTSVNLQSATSSDNGTSVDEKSTLVECTNGKQVLGMGWSLSGAAGNVLPSVLTTLSNPPDAAVVAADENGPLATNWDLTGYAICGYPPVAMTFQQGSSNYDSASPKTASVDCPAGSVMTSAGFDNGGGASSTRGGLLVDSLMVEPGKTSASVQVWENDFTPPAANPNWSATSFGLCAS